jgi:hypothetical protein
MNHQCPGPRCTRDDIPAEMLACTGHWYQVPRALRTAVWRAWDDGAGALSPEHNAAVKAAVARMRVFNKDRPNEG